MEMLKASLRTRRPWWVLIGLTTLWLLWMTLQPDSTPNDINLIPLSEHGWALSCLVSGSCYSPSQALQFILIDIAGNIAVFVPLGFGLAGALHQANPWPTLRRAILGGFSLSLTIELIQLAIPSRATDVDDLIFNTLGVTLGACLFILLNQSARPAKHRSIIK